MKKEIKKIILGWVESGESLNVTVDKLFELFAKHLPDDKVCSYYVSGMDTSGKCNNCGKNKWEHK